MWHLGILDSSDAPHDVWIRTEDALTMTELREDCAVFDEAGCRINWRPRPYFPPLEFALVTNREWMLNSVCRWVGWRRNPVYGWPYYYQRGDRWRRDGKYWFVHYERASSSPGGR